MSTHLIGQTVPQFSLETDENTIFESTSLNGTWRVIFFYSRNNSPTCKRGCLTFKEQHDLFASAGCSIIGIGPGSVEEQAAHKERGLIETTWIYIQGDRIVQGA